jgi:hypothetical protein
MPPPQNWTLGRVEPRTRTTILEIKQSCRPTVHQPGGLAAAQHQPGEGNLAAAKAIAANQNMDPQTNPKSVPQTNQNSVPQTSNTLAHQANPIKQLPNNDFLKVIQAEPLPVPTTSGSPVGGSPAAQHQSIEGQGLSIIETWRPIVSNSVPFKN